MSELDQASALADLSAALEATETLKGFSPNLGWSHYRSLSTIEHHAERLFYEIEPERYKLHESELKAAIIEKLQLFHLPICRSDRWARVDRRKV